MSWNHRVVRHKGKAGEPDYYAIHEAFYGEPGNPLITKDPVDVGTEDDPPGTAIQTLRWTLEHMLNCLDKPVLDFDTREEIKPV